MRKAPILSHTLRPCCGLLLIASLWLAVFVLPVRPVLTIQGAVKYVPYELVLPEGGFATAREAWAWIKRQLGGKYTWKDVDFSRATTKDLDAFPKEFYNQLLSEMQREQVKDYIIQKWPRPDRRLNSLYYSSDDSSSDAWLDSTGK